MISILLINLVDYTLMPRLSGDIRKAIFWF